MTKPEVSLILPSLNRPKKLVNAINNLIQTCDPVPIEIIVILDPSDLKSQEVIKELEFPGQTLLDPSPKANPVKAWNYGASVSNGNWLYIASDDVICPRDWLTKGLNTPNQGFMGYSDGRVQAEYANFYMATRDWLRAYQGGVLCVPHYQHWGLDPEICMRARNLGHYVLAHGVIFDHKHPVFGNAKSDSTYKKASKHYREDMELFGRRWKAGFPNDFEGYL